MTRAPRGRLVAAVGVIAAAGMTLAACGGGSASGCAGAGGCGGELVGGAWTQRLAGRLLRLAHAGGLGLGTGDALALALRDQTVVDLLIDLDLFTHRGLLMVLSTVGIGARITARITAGRRCRRPCGSARSGPRGR